MVSHTEHQIYRFSTLADMTHEPAADISLLSLIKASLDEFEVEPVEGWRLEDLDFFIGSGLQYSGPSKDARAYLNWLREDKTVIDSFADTRVLMRNVLKQLASKEGKDIPEDGIIQRLMLYGGSDQVLQKHFLSNKAESELDRLNSRFSQIYYDNLLRFERPIESLKD
ncbi:hypothetical protein RIF29_19764 [Crotalaria pallida]|uniref:Uncharacterized protein n=1 Tax=Crotalaria pallida TaxID=3830 RepID=A0AAN9I806_CROPI